MYDGRADAARTFCGESAMGSRKPVCRMVLNSVPGPDAARRGGRGVSCRAAGPGRMQWAGSPRRIFRTCRRAMPARSCRRSPRSAFGAFRAASAGEPSANRPPFGAAGFLRPFEAIMICLKRSGSKFWPRPAGSGGPAKISDTCDVHYIRPMEGADVSAYAYLGRLGGRDSWTVGA